MFQPGNIPFSYADQLWYAKQAMRDKRTTEHKNAVRPTEIEALVVDLTRLAAKDDSAGIRRRVRRWLASTSVWPDTTPGLKNRLVAALEEEGSLAAPRKRLATPVLEAPESNEMEVSRPPIASPILAPTAERQVTRIIDEYERKDELAAVGLAPTRTLLISGPPGVGKTHTATWLAERLSLPMFSVEPSEVMTSLLGESAKNLVSALSAAREEPSVVLLDEVDSFGKSRTDLQDVGELKRLVTTLLVELDRWPDGSLLVAATNHPELLDHALERRFEVKIEMKAPGKEERARILESVLGLHGQQASPPTLMAAVGLTEGFTGSDLRSAALRSVRTSVLDGTNLDTVLLCESLPRDVESIPKAARADFARVMKDAAGLSHREIADLLGCSHTAVGRMLRDREDK